MTRKLCTVTILVALSAALFGALPGCLVGGHSEKEVEGRIFTDEDFTWIEKGETRYDQIKDRFGPPDSTTERGGITKAVYRARIEVEESAHLFLIFHFDSEKTTTETVTFEIENGIVTDYYKDEY